MMSSRRWQRLGRGRRGLVLGPAFQIVGLGLAVGIGSGASIPWRDDPPAPAGAPEVVGQLEGHRAAVYGVSWNAEGTLAVTAGFDNTARVWDHATGKERHVFTGHTGLVLAARFSPDGTRLATASLDRTVKLWTLPNLAPRVDAVAPGPVSAFATNRAGQRGLAAIQGRAVTIDLTTGSFGPVWEQHEHLASAIETVALAPAEDRAALGAWDGRLTLWAVAADPTTPPTLQGSVMTPSTIRAIAFLGDGQTVATAGADGVGRLIPVASLVEPTATTSWARFDGPAVVARDGSRALIVTQAVAAEGDAPARPAVARVIQLDDAAVIREFDLTAAGITGTIALAAAHADLSRWAIVTSHPNAVHLADATGETVALKPVNLGEAAPSVTAAAFRADGEAVALGLGDGRVRVVSFGDAALVKEWAGHNGAVSCLAFHPGDGNQLLSGGPDPSAKLWNVAEGQAVREFPVGGAVHAVAFSRDGAIVAAASGRDVPTFQAGDAKAIATLTLSPPIPITSNANAETSRIVELAYGPDNTHLAARTADGGATVVNVAARVELQRLGEGDAVALGWKGDGAGRPIVAGRTRAISEPLRVARVLLGTGVTPGRSQTPQAVALAVKVNDPPRVFLGLSDGSAREFDPANGQQTRSYDAQSGPIQGLAVSPDGAVLATISQGKSLRFWKAGDGGLLLAVPLETIPTTLTIDPDGKKAAVGDDQGSVRLVALDATEPDRAVLKTIDSAHQGAVVASRFDGGTDGVELTLWTLGTDARLRRWSVVDPAPLTLQGHNGQVYDLAWSPDGSTLYSVGSDNALRVWNSGDGSAQAVQSQAHRVIAYAVAIDPKGSWLATGGDDATIALWNPANPGAGATRRLQGHNGSVLALSAHPNGGLLASASADGTIRLWEVGEPTREVAVLEGHPDEVYGLAWSHDGARLASIGYGGSIRIWNLSDLTQPRLVRSWNLERGLQGFGVAFHPREGLLGVAASHRKVTLYAAP